MNKQNKTKLIDIENGMVVARREEGWGVDKMDKVGRGSRGTSVHL